MLNLHSIEALLDSMVMASRTRLLYSLPNDGLLPRWTLLRRISMVREERAVELVLGSIQVIK
jgi:hypothetical protein